MPVTSALMPLLDFCFPRECPACSAGFESPTLLCPDCENDMHPGESAAACRRCAVPLPAGASKCPHCLGRGLRPFSKILSLGLFRGPIKTVIHQAKYQHRWPLMERLTDRLLNKRDLSHWLDGVDALVPVPLHSSRQRERGFNQADVIARRITRQTKTVVIYPAVRIRATESQTQMTSAGKRESNMKDAFVLTNPSAVHGKHLVLVDDVMTTGSTLVSLARALQSASPSRLSVIVLYVADPRGREFEVI